MRLEIHFLRHSVSLKQLLRDDGWSLARDCATHPEINDQQTARVRLDRLGLLTSPSVRIDFLLSRHISR